MGEVLLHPRGVSSLRMEWKSDDHGLDITSNGTSTTCLDRPLRTPDDFVDINVCGTVYQPMKETLEKFPHTLLGDGNRIQMYYVDFLQAYYFDRNKESFEAILYYYQSKGSLIRPTNIPMDMFVSDARFFEISEEVIENMQKMEGYVSYESDQGVLLPENKVQRWVWQLMEHPESSLLARIITIISILIILSSIITFCIETIPKFSSTHHHHFHKAHNDTHTTVDERTIMFIRVNEIIEVVSIVWFTSEYVIRLLTAPKKRLFFKSFLNLIDLAAIFPYFITLAIQSKGGTALGVMRVARLFRVVRVFKLSRHSMGLQILGNTLYASVNELAMIAFMLCFCIITFSSAIYYAEYDSCMGGGFESIPSTFWYILVTMTTVGYGDFVPLSFIGKSIGGLCAVFGVVTIAMVVPVIVTNFEFFYKRDKIIALKRKQKLLVDEQHDLKKRDDESKNTVHEY